MICEPVTDCPLTLVISVSADGKLLATSQCPWPVLTVIDAINDAFSIFHPYEMFNGTWNIAFINILHLKCWNPLKHHYKLRLNSDDIDYKMQLRHDTYTEQEVIASTWFKPCVIPQLCDRIEMTSIQRSILQWRETSRWIYLKISQIYRRYTPAAL